MNKHPVNTIVIGQAQTNEQKPITLLFRYHMELGMVPVNTSTPTHSHIELFCRNYQGSGFDFMYAYNDPNNRNEGVLYLGYWNGGFVG